MLIKGCYLQGKSAAYRYPKSTGILKSSFYSHQSYKPQMDSPTFIEVRALSTLVEDLGSTPFTNLVTHNYL